jgi:hypothetical protein
VHGGAFRHGTKDSGVARLFPFARRGYVCASVEYRLSGEAPWPAQIEDCKCAVRYLRAHAAELGLDPEKVLAEQTIRDERDRTREHSPLQPAAGAVVIDTTNLTLPEVVERIASLAAGTRR